MDIYEQDRPQPQPMMSFRARRAGGQRRRWPYAILGILLLAGAGWWLWPASPAPVASRPAGAGPTVELAAAELAPVRRLDIRRRVRFSGTTRAVEQVQVRAEVAAQVSEVLVREGDRVTAGQTLARLDTRDLEAALNQRLANLASSEANLAFVQRDLDNKRSLAARGAGSTMAAQQALAVSQQAQAALDANRALVAQARKALADATILAPIDGIVGRRSIDEGGAVAVNGEVFRILDLSTLEVDAAVPAQAIPLVLPGQGVTVRVASDQPARSGTVVRINPATEAGSQVVLVHVSLPNPDASLRAGVFVSGAIIVAIADQVLAVPQEAIRRDAAGSPYVFAVAEGRITQNPVTLGLASDSDGLVEILSGLSEDATIIRAPLPGLQAGQAVTVSAPRGAAS